MRRKKTFGVLGLLMLGLGLYSFRRRLVSRWLGLRPPRHRVAVRRDLQISMPDGVKLIADLYAPLGKGLFPTILIRTPYGRGRTSGVVGVFPTFVAQRFAEHGYNVLVQDVRGRFDSQGEFNPFVHEANDGRATLAWIEKQPWFNGLLGMWGPSYLGFVQWAVAPGAPLYLRALFPMISGSQLPLLCFRDGPVALDTALRWLIELDAMDSARTPLGIWKMARPLVYGQERLIESCANHLPLSELDRIAVGRTLPFFQKWLDLAEKGEAYLQQLDLIPDLNQVTAAVHIVSGWYDILLHEALLDYVTLRNKGLSPYLTIGPWWHLSAECLWESLRQGMNWFDAHLKGDRRWLRQHPVRIYVMGADQWREMDSWPPPAQQVTYYLHSSPSEDDRRSGVLRLDPPPDNAPPAEYLYDPAHPTPSLGGALMSLQAGPQDNRALESRSDVLTYTTPPLPGELEIIGGVRLDLYVRSSLETADFFGRLCDVYPDGRSMNICDGLLRINHAHGEIQPDGSRFIQVDLGATAYRFHRGHRIRLQVSSGAHPRWSRNLGMGQPIGSGVKMQVAHQMVYHDRAHPSAVIMPLTYQEE